jgi:hypothetical protein
MADTYKRGRDFLGDLDVDSYISWEINFDSEGKNNYLYGHVKIADCNRRVELLINDLKDLGKLDTIREHLDRFEREFRKRYKGAKSRG